MVADKRILIIILVMIICAVTLGLLKRSETKSLFWLRGSDKRKFRIECDSVGDATETRSDDMDGR
jgi:hypothetical protein